ncbi:nicotinamide N-methyltransferase Nnt1 [Trichophyton equinum CBS 127.97]|uniref:Nicotinamide N-methyltransferase Nnt1 n=1 Tax=Trichophyton equinum (strain ATCC MYA-4606 / CBS 127.97) TaxID=559882 RepID=F2PIM5_TRIEC|nr:nicotinamide N-methyltransferase Nnt1 [Trichophyton equinum CBS 127.97]
MGLELQDEAFGFGDIFKEPEGFFPPPKPPTFSEHRMLSGDTLNIRLVGSHPLYKKTTRNGLKVKTSSNWGQVPGLPSIICAIMGAKTVVVTDYPDHDLIDNMRINASACEKFIKEQPSPLYVEGYKWGDPTGSICRHLESPSGGFDVLILADVIYNHPQHHSLIDSVKMTLKRSKTSVAFVVFTPYQPWLLEKITAFFPKAEQSGFTVKKIFERVMDKLLFEDDPGEEQLRRTVFGYELRWKAEELDRQILS